jgi:ribosomal protein S9
LNFKVIPNMGKTLKFYTMKQLSEEKAKELIGGTTPVGQCAYNIGVSASLGGLFGGAGALVGAIAAATGPSCLALW